MTARGLFRVAGSTTVYVSPTGTGTGASLSDPASMDAALAANGAADYRLLPGVYRRSSPVTLAAKHAGSTIESHDPADKAVFHGSQIVTGWSVFSGSIQRAAIPVGSLGRRLFVNGSGSQIAMIDTSTLFGTLTKTATGYTTTKTATVSGSAYLRWVGPDTANIGWHLWTDRYAPFTVAGTTITVPAQAWENLDPTGEQGVGIPNIVMNTVAAITGPGQSVIDAVNGYAYYWPRSGENLATAEVALPVSVGLLKADGVDDLTIRNLEFTQDAFDFGSDGFSDSQSTIHQTPAGSQFTTATVDLRNTHRSTVSGISVYNNGLAAVNVIGKSSNNTVTGNTLIHLGGSGVQIGGLDNNETDNTNNVVSKNRITNLGEMILSGTGIFAGYVKDTQITDNYVQYSNYSGISLGWGWGATSNMGGNKILRNKVLDVMLSVLQDGGAIYILGPQAATNRSVVAENRVDGDNQPNGAIYLDGASSNVDVHSNVVSGLASRVAWLFLQCVPGQETHGNNIWSNYVTDGWVNDNNHGTGTPSTGNTVTGTVVVADPAEYSDETRRITAAAGRVGGATTTPTTGRTLAEVDPGSYR